jgi:hypothetical protein
VIAAIIIALPSEQGDIGLERALSISNQFSSETGSTNIEGGLSGRFNIWGSTLTQATEWNMPVDEPIASTTLRRRPRHARVRISTGRSATNQFCPSRPLSGSGPLAFASIDVDIYTSAKSALKLIPDSKANALLPTGGLHFDDAWSEYGYNRFAGELLVIDEINNEYEVRKIDRDRYVDHWHDGTQPWHAAMYMFHALDHPGRFKSLRLASRVISQ